MSDIDKLSNDEAQRIIDAIEHSIEKSPESDSPYNRVMKTWARWMTLVDQQHSEGNANPQDVKEFMACGEAVDVMVNDLPIAHRWAIRKAYGITPDITRVWRFPSISVEGAILDAEQMLTPKMKKNVATKRYFL